MSLRWMRIAVVLSAGLAPAWADDVLYRYEGDVLPYDESAGWSIANRCDPPCSEWLEDGHFVLRWPHANNLANYDYSIAEPPEPPPRLAITHISSSCGPGAQRERQRVPCRASLAHTLPAGLAVPVRKVGGWAAKTPAKQGNSRVAIDLRPKDPHFDVSCGNARPPATIENVGNSKA